MFLHAVTAAGVQPRKIIKQEVIPKEGESIFCCLVIVDSDDAVHPVQMFSVWTTLGKYFTWCGTVDRNGCSLELIWALMLVPSMP